MDDLISRRALYERAATLEAQALDYVGKLIERDGDEYSTEWKIWSAILVERTAFKHDVYDAPSAQPEIVRCRECKWWEKQEDSTLGYCNAAKHCYYSLNWEVQIYRRHRADFFCADGERRSEK